jgi:dynactin complex subunit
MDMETRLREAIKQTELAIEEETRPDIIRNLEHGKESLEQVREQLE